MVVSLLGLRPGERSLYLPHELVVQEISWGKSTGYVPGLCRDGKDLFISLLLLDSRTGIVQGLYTFCQSP